jgi:hypothetical protein
LFAGGKKRNRPGSNEAYLKCSNNNLQPEDDDEDVEEDEHEVFEDDELYEEDETYEESEEDVEEDDILEQSSRSVKCRDDSEFCYAADSPFK